MSEDQEQDLRGILKHGILIAWERQEIEKMISEGWVAGDKFEEVCARHPYALEKARKQVTP